MSFENLEKWDVKQNMTEIREEFKECTKEIEQVYHNNMNFQYESFNLEMMSKKTIHFLKSVESLLANVRNLKQLAQEIPKTITQKDVDEQEQKKEKINEFIKEISAELDELIKKNHFQFLLL